MEDFTEDEKKFYKLLFVEGKSATEASEALKREGLEAEPWKLRQFKMTIHERIDSQMRQERMMENMLESFDRTKIEFEDSVQRLKRWIEEFESRGQTFQAMVANRELLNHIALSLKVLGKIQSSLTSIQARNVNIVSTDFVEAFKRNQERYFEEMDARIENGKLVFNNPSPELLDDYNRWLAKNPEKKLFLNNEIIAKTE